MVEVGGGTIQWLAPGAQDPSYAPVFGRGTISDSSHPSVCLDGAKKKPEQQVRFAAIQKGTPQSYAEGSNITQTITIPMAGLPSSGE